MRLIKIKDDFGNALTIGKVTMGKFLIERNRSKHFFVKYDGWAVDKLAIEGLADVEQIIIRDKDSRKTYRVSREEFLKKATPISNFGHREQLVLKESDWEMVEI